MDIAMVFPGCHRRGGVERLVYEAARYFSAQHLVTVYAHEFEEEGLDHVCKRPVDIGWYPRALRVVQFSRRAREALKGTSHDHVISFGVAAVGADVLWVNSVHAAWLDRRDTVAGDRLRSSPLRRYLPRNQVMLRMERQYFVGGRGGQALVVSDEVRTDLERFYGFPRGRCVVVHNGFDRSEFSPVIASRGRAELRAELKIPPDSVVALLVANELSRKGLVVLLDAVAALREPRLHILLVGRADPSSYMRRIGALGLASRFHYGGSRTDMARVHGASDILVLPTRYEAFSLAIVEALASGLPVITTDVPGARDVVVDGVNGRLQRNPTSSDELAALLGDALEEDRYRKWATNAPQSVQDHTWPQLLDRALVAIGGGAVTPDQN